MLDIVKTTQHAIFLVLIKIRRDAINLLVVVDLNLGGGGILFSICFLLYDFYMIKCPEQYVAQIIKGRARKHQQHCGLGLRFPFQHLSCCVTQSYAC